MDIFKIHRGLIDDYKAYIRSFIKIHDNKISEFVENRLSEGLLWPEPLIRLNPSFETTGSVGELVRSGVLNPACDLIFRRDKDRSLPGKEIHLFGHQREAIDIAARGENYVLTTGTGSGKSLSYFIPIVDRILKDGPGKGIRAIIVYPVNALVNSQTDELNRLLNMGYPPGTPQVTFARYTGQESDEQKKNIRANPPDILVTNFYMLELILIRANDRKLVDACHELKFLVLDELHTYRGRQGSDLALLIRRLKRRVEAKSLQCIGTSATLAGSEIFADQQKEVSNIASMIFGDDVHPQHVVGESLKRTTPIENLQDEAFIDRLRNRIQDNDYKIPASYHDYVSDPLSSWLESTLGVSEEQGSGRLIRSTPRNIRGKDGVALELCKLTGVDENRCEEVIRQALLAGYNCEPNPETGFKPFAFRLHQFISRGGNVFSTLEPEHKRHLTVFAQQYVPGNREKKLFPLVFCRECGQEYYRVIKHDDNDPGNPMITPWENDEDRICEGTAGYIYLGSSDPWPEDANEVMERLPDDWLEIHKESLRIKRYYRQKKLIPQRLTLSTNGHNAVSDSEVCYFVPSPFRFCLHCGISYKSPRTDFAQLLSLGSEGRSTATTILSLSTIKHLRAEEELTDIARKMLSFADNRQDASLQAGHFNDFIEIGMLRGAIYKAATCSERGMSHEELPQRVFAALDLPMAVYASNPNIRFSARQDTDAALRQVLGYRVYKDLKRGWRINAPNLEQCGLLEILYPVLDEVCQAEDVWENCHPALVNAPPHTRKKIAKVLLDHMRRELAIKVDFLDPQYQERIKQSGSQRLITPWGVDEDEKMERARILFPTISPNYPISANYIFLSERSGFALYLMRQNTFTDYRERLKRIDAHRIIRDLLAALEIGGLVEKVISEDNGLGVPGYQLVAAALQWKAGEGTRISLDPIRFPRQPEMGSETNPFFVNFYRSTALELNGYEAREHTAQVQTGARIMREKLFREGQLPVLYCSPTMELGVDIKDLNVVNMRNVPPTPANYAQRSGRAGRSGQPALIYTYCSVKNSHDQYFFKRPALMVSGAVTTPCLDLANEDLVRSHIQAVWLAETRLELGATMKNIMDVSGENPSLELLPQVRQCINDPAVTQRTLKHSCAILEYMMEYLEASDWYTPEWLEDVVNQAAQNFDRTCDRWRNLFTSALNQARVQGRAALDASRSVKDKERAASLEKDARKQLDQLLDDKEVVNSDFYVYRYFATEGFLPGYGFPRLPLTAFIPGRKFGSKDDYLSRPRFIAIAEFGPNATVYHEGSRYRIHKVILPVTDNGGITLGSAKCCPACGYLHPGHERESYDVCELCKTELAAPYVNLFRMQNVSTQRREKINSDEEERLRLGFDIQTMFRFNRRDGVPLYRRARVISADGKTLLAQFKYGAAATIWRMNLGRRRRSRDRTNGFWLDLDTGVWSRPDDPRDSNNDETRIHQDEENSSRKEMVIPFVEDRSNCLLLSLEQDMERAEMASLQAALKRAIQVEYQLEDRELSVEPLPNIFDRQHLFFYESAEGGAGVLRRLTDDAGALAKVARQALELCHFDPLTGNRLKGAQGADQQCEAACYDCLLSYYNQRDHRILDRKPIKHLLMQLKDARVDLSPAVLSREEHLEQLMSLADSALERGWLSFLDDHQLNLPTAAQKTIESCQTRPDFWYQLNNRRAAVYIDGPVHLYPQRQARQREQEECLEDMGIRVIRFGNQDDWESIVKRYPDIFGDWRL